MWCKGDLVVVNVNFSGVDAAERYEIRESRAAVDRGWIVHVDTNNAEAGGILVQKLLIVDVRGKSGLEYRKG